jgi:hypothetical protein
MRRFLAAAVSTQLHLRLENLVGSTRFASAEFAHLCLRADDL